MDLNTITNIVEIAVIAYVGFILKNQIKSQNSLIQNMKQYSDMIDINKLEAYTSSMIKLAQTEAKLDAIKYIKEELSTDRYDEKLKSIDQEHCEEYLLFSLFAYVNSKAEMRRQIKSKFFPKSGHFLDKIALGFDIKT
jgi:hypothetical protein